MRRQSNACIAVIIVCGLILSSFLGIGNANGATSGEINSDAPWVTAADSPTPNEEFTIIKTNSTISEPIFNHTTSEVTFTVTGPSGTTGYVWCKIAENLIPHRDTEKNVKVLLDGNQIYYMYTFDDGAWELYFEYNHSSHEVVISLPEQPWTLLGISPLAWVALIAVVALTAVIVFWRRKQRRYANDDTTKLNGLNTAPSYVNRTFGDEPHHDAI
ncbi:MAG: hypothetical protein NWF00_10120 [Candidatus Bathyarchaeota archaeon]|nr:hypothetical protein [Candidatus Bathyarchaeota archaeon]